MSWFNTSHLSSFAKQALTSAQKSIDRVLDIKEEDQWGDTTVMPFNGTKRRIRYKVANVVLYKCRLTAVVYSPPRRHFA